MVDKVTQTSDFINSPFGACKTKVDCRRAARDRPRLSNEVGSLPRVRLSRSLLIF